MKKATFGAGCFWGVEEAFRRTEGVIDTAAGYCGGHVSGPTYEEVCSGTTGHAEAVQVEYDPQRVSYEHLLEIFWQIHDPTTLDRQGPDVGSQYRSVIFYHDEDQQNAALASQARLGASGRWHRPVVTQVVPATTFYRAEEYHQRYLEKTGASHCSLPW